MSRTVVAGSPAGFTRSSTDGDGYLSKLVKYVPVEGLAPFIPIAALASGKGQLVLAFVVSLVAGLLLIVAQVRKNDEKPRVWYWPFVVLAFAAWSTGASSDFRELLDVSEQTGAFYLGLTSVALPVLDSALDAVFPRRG